MQGGLNLGEDFLEIIIHKTENIQEGSGCSNTSAKILILGSLQSGMPCVFKLNRTLPSPFSTSWVVIGRTRIELHSSS